jgi:hypothetical protein
VKGLKLRSAALALFFALFFAGVGAVTALAAQTHMVTARGYLQSALSELQQAEADKGGHRANAINLVNRAIDQINLGIQYARGT